MSQDERKTLIHIFEQNEQLTNRYIEAEKFIMNLNWFERLFCSRKINNFIDGQLKKYNF